MRTERLDRRTTSDLRALWVAASIMASNTSLLDAELVTACDTVRDIVYAELGGREIDDWRNPTEATEQSSMAIMTKGLL